MIEPPSDLSGYDPIATKADCWWDAEAAERVIGFFGDALTFTRGHTGPFILQPWQRNILATLFGWKRPDGTRRYRETLIAIPRKNGKTELLAGIAIYCLLCDGEPMPEVDSAAFSREQASLIFDAARQMVSASEDLAEVTRIVDTHKRITSANGGFYRALAAEVAGAHGYSPSAVLFDELHTQRNRELYDVLKTAQGARDLACRKRGSGGTIFANITTAGHDRHSICWEVWDYSRKVRDAIIPDTYFLPVIYEMAEGDDWSDRDVWRRVNPNIDVSTSMSSLEEMFERARSLPAVENSFRNLHLNQWTEQATRWFSMDRWDACAADVETHGASCFAGLDLSATTDLSALALVFDVDGKTVLKCHYWVPEDQARERERRDRVPYLQWIRDGWITATPGSSVDYDRIRADISRISEQHDLRCIAIDRWNANQLAHQLQDDGFNVGFFGQGYASMSSPSKEFEAMLLDGSFVHDANPVTRWMASNVAVEKDAAGNIKPSKKVSTERIDGIVAAIMAIGTRALQSAPTWADDEIGL